MVDSHYPSITDILFAVVIPLAASPARPVYHRRTPLSMSGFPSVREWWSQEILNPQRGGGEFRPSPVGVCGRMQRAGQRRKPRPAAFDQPCKGLSADQHQRGAGRSQRDARGGPGAEGAPTPRNSAKFWFCCCKNPCFYRGPVELPGRPERQSAPLATQQNINFDDVPPLRVATTDKLPTIARAGPASRSGRRRGRAADRRAGRGSSGSAWITIINLPFQGFYYPGVQAYPLGFGCSSVSLGGLSLHPGPYKHPASCIGLSVASSPGLSPGVGLYYRACRFHSCKSGYLERR